MFAKLKAKKDELVSKNNQDKAKDAGGKAMEHPDAGKHAGSVAEKMAKKHGLGMFSKEIGAGVKAIVEGKQKATAEAKTTNAPATVTTTAQTTGDSQPGAPGTTTEVTATSTAQPPPAA